MMKKKRTTRLAIASNSGCHPVLPLPGDLAIARVTAAILKFLKPKNISLDVNSPFCKVSLSFEHFDFFAISMATVAILKIPLRKGTTSDGCSHYGYIRPELDP